MENITYGYVRVSSKDQNIERQLIALKNAGISEKHIYIDRQSGKNFDRPAYKSMLKKLKSGDIIVTKRLLSKLPLLSVQEIHHPVRSSVLCSDL